MAIRWTIDRAGSQSDSLDCKADGTVGMAVSIRLETVILDVLPWMDVASLRLSPLRRVAALVHVAAQVESGTIAYSTVNSLTKSGTIGRGTTGANSCADLSGSPSNIIGVSLQGGGLGPPPHPPLGRAGG